MPVTEPNAQDQAHRGGVAAPGRMPSGTARDRTILTDMPPSPHAAPDPRLAAIAAMRVAGVSDRQIGKHLGISARHVARLAGNRRAPVPEATRRPVSGASTPASDGASQPDPTPDSPTGRARRGRMPASQTRRGDGTFLGRPPPDPDAVTVGLDGKEYWRGKQLVTRHAYSPSTEDDVAFQRWETEREQLRDATAAKVRTEVFDPDREDHCEALEQGRTVSRGWALYVVTE